ncbi:helix-turn-helix domain-containing protein [Brevibacillus nitrificans]|uniref:TetR/AcrR family transcriptional regulator n=1 Tax=Brevibacillus nitrificans TaxID=651560 RepID=UPI0028569A7D|nr:helix-turn-helix domain-containing protein [Brevibacillus nitrificans]MDR7314313.1 AcrR family transcriptional regulator [Brevibacillus nitrificans]
MKLSLREKKKAKTKLALLHASLNLIGERSFRQVPVEEICQQVDVSKVTFFKFFPQKEDVLIFFMSVWQAQCFLELVDSGKRGWEGVRHIYGKVAEDARKQPGIMLSLISFLSEQKMHPWVPKLTEAELSLLFPERDTHGVEEVTLDQIFKRCVKEIKEEGELVDQVTAEEAVELLFSIFYGAFLSAHLFRSTDYLAYYDMHLKLLRR